jgi:hypothetical protein
MFTVATSNLVGGSKETTAKLRQREWKIFPCFGRTLLRVGDILDYRPAIL